MKIPDYLYDKLKTLEYTGRCLDCGFTFYPAKERVKMVYMWLEHSRTFREGKCKNVEITWAMGNQSRILTQDEIDGMAKLIDDNGGRYI